DRLELSPQQETHESALRAAMSERAAALITLDPLTRSDREGEVERWLTDLGVDEPWELAPTLVNFGWSVADFKELGTEFSPKEIAVLVEAMSLRSGVFSLLD